MLEIDGIKVVKNHRAGLERALENGIVTEAGLSSSRADVTRIGEQPDGRVDLERDGRDLGEEARGERVHVDVYTGCQLVVLFVRIFPFSHYPLLAQSSGAEAAVVSAGGKLVLLDLIEEIHGQRLPCFCQDGGISSF